MELFHSHQISIKNPRCCFFQLLMFQVLLTVYIELIVQKIKKIFYSLTFRGKYFENKYDNTENV